MPQPINLLIVKYEEVEMSLKRCLTVLMLAAAMFSVVAIAGAVNVSAQEKEAVSTTTLDNLMAAYNGENNAHVRYLAFAKQAELEGYGIVASLFRAAALAEQFHYERDAKLIAKLGGTPKANIETPVVKSTKENIEAAIKAETYENKTMYPDFVKQAKKEGHPDAADAFEDAGAAEGSHAQLYQRVLNNLALSQGLVRDYYVCPVCGNIMDSITRSMCPICMTSAKEFKRVR
jgi:rubrerythrin